MTSSSSNSTSSHRGADRGGAIGDDLHVHRAGKRVDQLRQEFLDAVDHLDGVGAGLALDVQDDRRSVVDPGGELGVLHAVDDLCHVGEHDRRAVAVGDDHGPVGIAGEQLVVGVDGVVLRGTVEISLGGVEAVDREGAAQVFEIDAVGGQSGRVGLDAHGRLLSAGDADQADAGDLGDLGGEARVGEIFDLGERQHVGGEGQGQDRSIGRIGFAVDGRRGQVGRKITLRRIDGRLHLLLGHIDIEAELELHDDDRDASGAGRSHLAEPGDLAELALQGRSDGRGNHVGAGTGVKGEHLDGRVIHLRQRRNRKLQERHAACQKDRNHQQRRGDRTKDEWPRRTHEA